MRITNFGGNVSFVPRNRYAPRNEAKVVDLLNKHVGGKIRVVASLHSWSDVAASEDVVVDMRNFDSVEIAEAQDGQVCVTAGGGCGLQRLLDTIHGTTDATLPSLGAVKEQTIAGAISTATHGSGKHSLSHYIDELRVAAYDADTGRARVYEWTDGTELRAARCGLGCMGIILSVKFQCVPKYYVAETVVRRETLEEVLAQEKEFPLQQFILVPYLWSYFVYQRRATMTRAPWWGRWRTYLHRVYHLIGLDILFHMTVKALVVVVSHSWAGPGLVRWYYQKVFPHLILQNQTVVDDSENALTLKHHYFKHLEIELFVPARHIREATDLARHATSVFAAASETVPDRVASELRTIDMLETLMRHKGSYTHHYPIFFRRVLPDDTLISMTSGSNEPYYTISLFTYLTPRTQFYQFAGFLARSLTQLYDARLHWGKYYSLTHDQIERLYPRLEEFRQTCQKTDPNGVFRNEYTERVLGFVED